MNTANEEPKAVNNMELLKQQAEGCGAGCGCHSSGSSGKARWVAIDAPRMRRHTFSVFRHLTNRMLILKPSLAVMSVALSFVCQASRAAETDILPTLRPMVAQIIKDADQIPQERKGQLKKIALYVKTQINSNETPQLTFICTHNSRRSHLTQVWAQTAAAYYGVSSVKTFSGGTEATACNIRAVRALRRAGFSVVEAEPGKNPVYLVQYSESAPPLRAFSKVYNQGGNPTEKYLAVMTCAQADKNCPVVEGSSMRVAVPYVDPKESDEKPEEEATYNERCKQIATEMFYCMSLVKS